MKVIFIIGPPRSGTTLLGTIFSKVGSVAYIEEPNFIWRSSVPFRSHDVYTENDLTPKKIQIIKQRMASKVHFKSGLIKLVVEKTPANCLRLDYLRAIYPEAKFIFIYREKTDITKSMSKKWLKEEDANSLKLDAIKSHKVNHFRKMVRRFTALNMVEVVSYLPRIVGELLFLLNIKKRKFWGVRYKGWQHDVSKQMSVDEIVLKQVSECYKAIELFKIKLESCDYMSIEYSDLISLKNSIRVENILGIKGIDQKLEELRVKTVVK